MKFFFFSLMLSVLLSPAAQANEVVAGPLFGFSQSPVIQVKDCKTAWTVTSRYTAECFVQKWHENPAFLLQADTQIYRWKYDSGLRWRLYVTILKEANGYKIKLEADESTPKDRLEFKTAKKYIQSTLEEWNKTQFTQRVMRLGFMGSGAGEEALGPMYSVTRTVDLASASLRDTCEKHLQGNGNKRFCVLHFATYREGEVVVNQENLTLAATNKAKKINISLVASAGWRGYGVFSLGYLRVDYTGPYDSQSFTNLFTQAVRQSNRKTFDFNLHKIGSRQIKSHTFREHDIKAVQLVERRIRFDLDVCKPKWVKTSEIYGSCDIQLYESPVLAKNQQVFYEGNISGTNGQALVILRPTQKGYMMEVYGPPKAVEKFDSIRPYLKKALENAGHDTFLAYTLR